MVPKFVVLDTKSGWISWRWSNGDFFKDFDEARTFAKGQNATNPVDDNRYRAMFLWDPDEQEHHGFQPSQKNNYEVVERSGRDATSRSIQVPAGIYAQGRLAELLDYAWQLGRHDLHVSPFIERPELP